MPSCSSSPCSSERDYGFEQCEVSSSLFHSNESGVTNYFVFSWFAIILWNWFSQIGFDVWLTVLVVHMLIALPLCTKHCPIVCLTFVMTWIWKAFEAQEGKFNRKKHWPDQLLGWLPEKLSSGLYAAEFKLGPLMSTSGWMTFKCLTTTNKFINSTIGRKSSSIV